MKKLLLFTILLYGCKKDDPKPNGTHTLSVIDTHAQLYINGDLQNNINETFTVKNGDEIIVTDFGVDSYSPITGTTNEGYVNCKVILDNKTIYETHCNCDANFTKIIQ